jgi:hypothetical protein
MEQKGPSSDTWTPEFWIFLGRGQSSVATGSKRLVLFHPFHGSLNQVSQLLQPLTVLEIQPTMVLIIFSAIFAETTL